MEDKNKKFVVWKRQNKSGKWVSYSAAVSQLLEVNYRKESKIVCLGIADEELKNYSVHLTDMLQISEVTGTKSRIVRHLCDNLDGICTSYKWQWKDKFNSWKSYDIEVNKCIEESFSKGDRSVNLNRTIHGHSYKIDFQKMSQINKNSKRKRSIRRKQSTSPYPVIQMDHTNDVESCSQTDIASSNAYQDLLSEIPNSSVLEDQVNMYMQNVLTPHVSPTVALAGHDSITDKNSNEYVNPQNNLHVAIVNGRPWYDSHPPHTSQSKLKPVPGLDPLPKCAKSKRKKIKALQEPIDRDAIKNPIDLFTDVIIPSSDQEQECAICFEKLTMGSSYDGNTIVVKFKLCPHIFHKSCLGAMYGSGSQDKSLQCPTCKTIHGEKCGFQPPGSMVYHVLPYSLPGYFDCETIQIIYDISSGIQGPEHPNPGKRYTARGFPRRCYLPDNEIGRKIMRLLVEAWKRRLIFTIGASSTTGEENTVTWNEIHHKTEFGCNRRGHGYPDPNYFDNVLAELDAHGVNDNEVL